MINNKLIIFLIFSFVILFTGCYTQLGTVRQEMPKYEKEYTYDESDDYETYMEGDTNYYEQDDKTMINNYCYDGDYWYPRHRWMFSYYYPSYYWPSHAFWFSYYDPWYYDWYWHYDPWICGTPWIYYPYSYYSPYYYHYPYYYWGTKYYSDDGRYTRATRDFGSTRGRPGRSETTFEDRPDRSTGRGGYDLPTGVGVVGSGGRSQSGTSKEVQRPSRGDGSTRGVVPRSGDRTGTKRGESGQPRGGTRRERYERGDREQHVIPPPRESGRSPERSGTRDQGSSRGEETPSYTPPRSQPSSPPPSSPPSRGGDSRGGSSDDSGSNRGGSTRGGR